MAWAKNTWVKMSIPTSAGPGGNVNDNVVVPVVVHVADTQVEQVVGGHRERQRRELGCSAGGCVRPVVVGRDDWTEHLIRAVFHLSSTSLCPLDLVDDEARPGKAGIDVQETVAAGVHVYQVAVCNRPRGHVEAAR